MFGVVKQMDGRAAEGVSEQGVKRDGSGGVSVGVGANRCCGFRRRGVGGGGNRSGSDGVGDKGGGGDGGGGSDGRGGEEAVPAALSDCSG